MHEAYEIFHLLNGTEQIETIAAYDGNLLLGTRQGHLIMYSLSDNGNLKYELQLLGYHKNFSKKPIQQIEVIPENNLLLCLTDNILSTYDINNVKFPLVKTFAETKGASLFALDKTTTFTGEDSSLVVRLCVAVRRKLQLYLGSNGEFKKQLYEITIPDIPKVISWGTQYLCVGFKSEYTMYDLTTTKPKDLFPTSSSKSLDPTIVKYSATSFLLGRDQTSVLVEEGTGPSVEIKSTIKWKEAPIAIVWDAPYVLGLLEGKVVVQTVEPTLFVQTLSDLNKARLMYRCRRGLIFVVSVGQVWCLVSVDVAKQTQQLIEKKQFEIAITITNLGNHSEEEKKKTVNCIQNLFAHQLFEEKQYQQSMKEFSKLNIDPADVIKLFPELNRKPGEDHKGLKGQDLENALKALIQYLDDLRQKLVAKEGSSEDDSVTLRNTIHQLELIDTTLIKCYLQTNDASIAPLLRMSNNNCRLEEAEKILTQHGKYGELVILYQTKGQHTKALQLLKEHASQPDSSLKGYQKTKNYLQELGAEHINLIFNFSDWILKEHPEEGLKIFTEEKKEVENLPRPKILDFFLREHEQLVIPYLEHVIHVWNDSNSIFHDALINMYMVKITDKDATITAEELSRTKAKLLTFLEKSTGYTPERVILRFPVDSLYEERALILGKLGRHEQVLAIYVQILGQVDKALQYCEKVCQNSEDTNDVYISLMRILMNPETSSALTGPLASVPRHPKTAVQDLETTLMILEKHADKISPLKALSVLPDSVPLSRLKNFLQSSLDSQLTLKRRAQIMKGLLYAENLQVQELKYFHESKKVVINDYNVCPVCKKRFGNQSAFVRYPNGDIVHYSCKLDKTS